MKKLEDIWSKLESDKDKVTSGGMLKVSVSRKHGFSIGLDTSDSKKILLIEIDDDAVVDDNHFPSWEGTLIQKRETESGNYFVVLKLIDDECNHIFNALLNDVIVQIKETSNNSEALTCFIDLLFKWSEFFKKHGKKVLSEQRQRGLFGELYFIKHHLAGKIDGHKVIHFWKGHELKHHDFSFPNGALEVKTTIRKAHKKVVISSEKQLDDTGFDNLFLYCITLNMDSNSGQSLTGLVNELYEFFNDFPGASMLFSNYLNNSGYLEEHEEHYDENKYIFKKEYLFKVSDDFPKITDPPEGIGDIKYSLMIASVVDFSVPINESIDILV
tara:strand:+ start:54 stop:1037 length:984 start_codon:yes stop_codon:yes gene_type:complete